jgi:mRNA-degrading endonuclease RelE of RelBE toxin-antitoxin system
MHEILLERSVERDLRRLPAAEFVRIVREIKAPAANPIPNSTFRFHRVGGGVGTTGVVYGYVP